MFRMRDTTMILRCYDSITFARALLKNGPIDYLHSATAPVNRTCILQFCQSGRDPGPPHAKHHCEQVMGDWNNIIVKTIASEQKPAGHALLDLVPSVAKDCLRVLNEKSLDKGQKLLLKFAVFIDCPAELLGFNAQRLAFDVHEAPVGRSHSTQHNRPADQSEPANHADLDRTVTLGPSKEKGYASFDEIGVVRTPIRLLQDLVPF
jgi:hypothetical protein